MSERLTARLHELIFAMDAFAERVLTRSFGTDHNHFVFLSPLASGPMDVTRLAQSLNLSKAAVSKRVPVLEREGWLVTASDPGHGRRLLITLTPKGQSLLRGAGRVLNERFTAMLAGLEIDPEQLGEQARILTAAVRRLEADEQAGTAEITSGQAHPGIAAVNERQAR